MVRWGQASRRLLCWGSAAAAEQETLQKAHRASCHTHSPVLLGRVYLSDYPLLEWVLSFSLGVWKGDTKEGSSQSLPHSDWSVMVTAAVCNCATDTQRDRTDLKPKHKAVFGIPANCSEQIKVTTEAGPVRKPKIPWGMYGKVIW